MVDGEGAGGESAVALLTDAGDLTTCGGDGVPSYRANKNGQKSAAKRAKWLAAHQ